MGGDALTMLYGRVSKMEMRSKFVPVFVFFVFLKQREQPPLAKRENQNTTRSRGRAQGQPKQTMEQEPKLVNRNFMNH
jgi:hypothetical protein